MKPILNSFSLVDISLTIISLSLSFCLDSKSQGVMTTNRFSFENLHNLVDHPWLLLNRIDSLQRIPVEATMSTPELIRHHGYRSEEHHVMTADGYILTMFRIKIPFGRKRNNNNIDKEGRGMMEPVILQHGLQASSDNWLLNDPSSILPYLLVQENYDVWLMNARGNNYSKRHINLTTENIEYWDFSFHEMGIYDVPAIMSYVLQLTGQRGLSWVCHSMGTTMFFVAMSERPELQAKVRKMVALAPVAYIKHLKSPFRFVAYPTSWGFGKDFIDFTRRGRAFPSGLAQLLKIIGPAFCSGELANQLCKMYFIHAVGFNPATTSFAATVVSGHTPSDTSMKTIRHFAQYVLVERFQQYDYGREENLWRYGLLRPPAYNLTQIQIPILAMYANNDKLVVPQDALSTIRELGNVAEEMMVADASFSHFDFTYAKDVKYLVYDHIVKFLSC